MEPNEVTETPIADSGPECPIQQSLLANLIEYGVATDHIGFAHVTMQSSSFICVREQRQSAKSSLKIFDLRRGIEVSEKPMAAEAALMNPEKPHLALRAGGLIQIFDIDTKEKVSSIQADFPVMYWCWVSPSTLAMISDRHVYCWNYTTQGSKMTLWFDKSSSLFESQIIALQNEPQHGLAVLCGIGLKADRICGSMQLYSAGKKASQLIDGYCCCFFKLDLSSTNTPRTMLAYASFSSSKELRVHLTVIEPQQSTVAAKRVIDLDAGSLKDSDFPLSLCFDTASKFLIMHTKHGHVYIIDPATGVDLYNDNLADSPLYLVVPSCSPNDPGHFYLTRAGGVYQASIVFEQVLRYALNQGPGMFASVGAVSERLPIFAQKELYRSFFDHLRGQNRHHEALQLLALSSKKFLRTFEYMTMVKEFPPLSSSPALLVYFALILESGSLNEAESIELAQLALKKGKLDILRRWLEEGKIYCTEHLGDLVFDTDLQLADSIYKAAGCATKRINCYVASGKFSSINEIASESSAPLNLSELLKVSTRGGSKNQVKFIEFALDSLPDRVTADFIESVLEIPEDKPSSIRVLSKHAEALSALSLDQIMLQVIAQLVKYEPASATEFVLKSGRSLQSIAGELQAMLREAGMHLAAFLLCTQRSEAAMLAEFVCEEPTGFPFLFLPPPEVMALIGDLMEKDPQKYAALCGKLAYFVESSDRLVVKSLLFDHLEDKEDRFNILAQWMEKAPDSNVIQWYVNEAISLGKVEELETACQQHVFNDPRPVFETLKDIAPNSKALKILAKRYSLLVDLIAYMESCSDHDGIAQVIDMSGDDLLAGLPQLITTKIKDATIRKVIATAAKSLGAVLNVASELENMDKLGLLDDLANRSGELGDNRELYALKAKILCAADDKGFVPFAESNISKLDLLSLREYCELKRPEAMLELYSRTGGFEDLLQLSQKIGTFDSLLKYLVSKKDPSLWLTAISRSNGADVIEKAVMSTDLFVLPEEASAFAKCLVSSKKTAELVRFLKSLIERNPKFSHSRTTQTLLLLNLLSIDDAEFAKYATLLDCYDFEEVAHAAISSGKYSLGQAVLKQAGMWYYAFQVCLHGCGNLEEAAQLAKKCDDGKVNAALAEQYLSAEDHEGALDFAMKSMEFTSHHALLGLLELQGNYSGMQQYLSYLRTTRKLAMAAFDRFYLSCCVNLNMAKELNEIVSSVSIASAESMGSYLLHHERIDAAIACFQRSGSYGHLVSCYLQKRDLEAASDSASKCNNPRLWLRCFKACLRLGKYDLAEPLALKCLGASMSKDVISAYNSAGAFSQLIDLCETFVATNPTKAEVIFALGRTLNLHRPDSLEGFIQKYYSVLSDGFVEILKKHRRWKEAFKFHIMRTELELALSIVLAHPNAGLDPKKIFVLISKINRKGVFEKGLEYFHNYYPTGMIELQRELHGRVDLPALVTFCRSKETLWTIEELLRQQQGQNLLSVTEASVLNEQLLRSNDYYGLLESIKKQPNIDFARIRSALASSESRHFRVLAAKLGANSGGSPAESLKVLVQEDAVLESLVLLAQCGNREYSEAFLSRYSRSRNAVMFVAVAYVLFDQIRFDVLLEWMTRGRLTEAGLPLMCQVLRNRFP